MNPCMAVFVFTREIPVPLVYYDDLAPGGRYAAFLRSARGCVLFLSVGGIRLLCASSRRVCGLLCAFAAGGWFVSATDCGDGLDTLAVSLLCGGAVMWCQLQWVYGVFENNFVDVDAGFFTVCACTFCS